ncbi:MAG: class I SAM-dependent methyltransferase [Candidatus Adiutrix sp.]|jgi:SAM-dependent methyltransferase|nr:class I SAM-dependent methyltransferase [Candidatus Adiutrix sp.]
MNLNDILSRPLPPAAPAEGEAIPWNDPDFSRRMLANHLSQDHDWASRRAEIVAHQVGWLNRQLAPASRILDLACGPGLYTQALAESGHRCRGVDFSPASIDYARNQAEAKGLEIDYALADIRSYAAPDTFDVVMLIFGEFNVFTAAEAQLILANCARQLRPGGLFILEGHTFEAVRQTGEAAASWWTCGADEGIFSARPHLCLQENFWDEAASLAITRYYCLEAAGGQTRRYASAMTGYTLSRYERLLAGAGFHSPRVLPPEDWPVGGPFEGLMLTLASRKS